MKSVVMNFINKIKKNVNDESGMGVIEIVLIILGILTTYYGVSIRCIG